MNTLKNYILTNNYPAIDNIVNKLRFQLGWDYKKIMNYFIQNTGIDEGEFEEIMQELDRR